MNHMLGLDEAQRRVLAMAPQMPTEELPIEQTFGRFLACDLVARRTQPPADLSAMDGYAICGNPPWQLIGESRAGAPFPAAVEPGQCVRISTGAHMPKGTDRVLIQENADVIGGKVTCSLDMPTQGKHIRRRGFDFTKGDALLGAGTHVGPAQIALAVAAGHAKLYVRKAPSIAVLDSGDELAASPDACGPDQIPASNGAMIAAMLGALGCNILRIGPVADDEDALAVALRSAEGADILVTTGGASVGDHDLIRPALEKWGAKLDFWKVAIKPGKPLMVAQRGEQVILGLPGNPVSSFVTATLFLLPLVRAAMGSNSAVVAKANLPVGFNLPESGSRHEFLRAVWDGIKVSLVDSQDSSALHSLAVSNCLIERPPHSSETEAGTFVPVLLLANGGIA